jgi:DNA repair protein RadC
MAVNDENEEMINFLVVNRIYPMCSKNGKIFLWKPRNVILSDEKATEIINQLGLKTIEDCERIREIIKEKLAARRTNQPIRKWIKEERPREMLTKYGPEKLPLSKLLAILLRTGRESISAEELARSLLNRFKTLRGINSATMSELCEVEGVGQAKAAQIKAALELGKRLYREEAEKKRRLSTAQDVIGYVSDYYAPYLRDSNKEFFNVILLNARNKPIGNVELSKGSLTSSVVFPKEIIREATMKAAASIILVHNHPSGEADASEDDIETTNRIVKVCELVGIKVLDHIIVGRNKNDYFSFLEEGLIK